MERTGNGTKTSGGLDGGEVGVRLVFVNSMPTDTAANLASISFLAKVKRKASK